MHAAGLGGAERAGKRWRIDSPKPAKKAERHVDKADSID
jgi:hypothetical protein